MADLLTCSSLSAAATLSSSCSELSEKNRSFSCNHRSDSLFTTRHRASGAWNVDAMSGRLRQHRNERMRNSLLVHATLASIYKN